ncbi:histidine kinase [Lysinibacillus capsici]|uniref:histidine kinase n=1 Tax=Lysinibacillus capsici TaxID=2115968 RepID=UPI002152C15B|nr:histidine kinase [Lysinibacillus capsici]MCR6524931.1 histidine kinase [Lysinibacillus capsici]
MERTTNFSKGTQLAVCLVFLLLFLPELMKENMRIQTIDLCYLLLFILAAPIRFFINTLNSIISSHGVDEEKMEELLLAFSDYL